MIASTFLVAYYTMTPGPTTLDGGRITLAHGLASAKLCAQQCLAVAGDCVATAACTTTSSSTTVDCYFATAATPESSASQDLDEKCTMYTKANPNAKLEIDNAAVYAKLQEAIKMGELNIFLPEFLIDRRNTTMFVAVSIADVSPNSELS
ncbi:PREDICTED: uncharacterized protein LOC106820125, partial [Priapulus caudatus]|uniref:Uncharacterized protein LOC106820125 n=1 Tax=Priapulus caudatus TaxID=37621 RepID=A0ABM1F6T8_PRICU